MQTHLPRRPNALTSIALCGCIALWLAGCASPLRRVEAAAQFQADAPANAQLRKLRRDGFSETWSSAGKREAAALDIWRTLRDNFADPGMNGVAWEDSKTRLLQDLTAVRSDADYYRALKKLTADLKDSHTAILDPGQAEGMKHVNTTTGFAIRLIDRSLVVTQVMPDSAAQAAGVQPGMVIRKLNGHPVQPSMDAALAPSTDEDAAPASAPGADPRLAAQQRDEALGRRIWRSLLAEAGKTTSYTFEAADGTLRDLKVRASPLKNPPRLEWHAVPTAPGIHYLAFNRFRPDLMATVLSDLSGLNGTRDGLILDLRSNEGGIMQQALDLLSALLTESKPSVAQVRIRADGEVHVDNFSISTHGLFSGRIAVLTNGATASSAELTTEILREQRQARVFGEATCGCLTTVSFVYFLPDGGVLRLANGRTETAGGHRFERQPILPDQWAAPTLDSLHHGRDPAVDQAVAWLQAAPAGKPSSP